MQAASNPLREKQIFEQALDLNSEEERRQLLADACHGDMALFSRVQELLQAHAEATESLPERSSSLLNAAPFFSEPQDMGPETSSSASSIQTPAERTPGSEEVGDLLGRYLLVDQPIYKILLSHDGETAALMEGGQRSSIQVHKLPSGRHLSTIENEVTGLWDASTGAQRSRLSSPLAKASMDGAAWSPDGTRIAGLFKDSVRIWQVEGARELWSLRANADRCIRFSHDGQWLAYGNADGNISLVDSRDGQPVRTFERHIGPVKSLVFSPDDLRVFSGAADGTVRVWDSSTGDELLRLLIPGNRNIWSIDFSAAGEALAAADNNGVITVWKTGAKPLQ